MSTAGNPDIAHAQPVPPLEADGDAPVDIKAVSRAGSLEQFSSEDESNQCLSRSGALKSASPPFSTPPPVTAVTEIRSIVQECHSGIEDHSTEPILTSTQHKPTQGNGSLSAQPSFRGFSSEEDEGASEPEAERDDAGPDLSNLKTTKSPHTISAHGSFQGFSDEEVEEVQSFPGDQDEPMGQPLESNADASNAGDPIHLFEDTTGWIPHRPGGFHHHPTPAWLGVSFSPVNARPGSSALVPMGPSPSAKLKHNRFIERTRRTKFDAKRPFIPRHRPFTPRTPTLAVGQGIQFPPPGWTNATLQQPTWSTTPTRSPTLGPSHHAAHGSSSGLGYDKEMIDMGSIKGSGSSPTMPKQHVDAARPGVGNTTPDTLSGSPHRTRRESSDRTPQLSSVGCSLIYVGPPPVICALGQLHPPCSHSERALIANPRQGKGERSQPHFSAHVWYPCVAKVRGAERKDSQFPRGHVPGRWRV